MNNGLPQLLSSNTARTTFPPHRSPGAPAQGRPRWRDVSTSVDPGQDGLSPKSLLHRRPHVPAAQLLPPTRGAAGPFEPAVREHVMDLVRNAGPAGLAELRHQLLEYVVRLGGPGISAGAAAGLVHTAQELLRTDLEGARLAGAVLEALCRGAKVREGGQALLPERVLRPLESLLDGVMPRLAPERLRAFLPGVFRGMGENFVGWLLSGKGLSSADVSSVGSLLALQRQASDAVPPEPGESPAGAAQRQLAGCLVSRVRQVLAGITPGTATPRLAAAFSGIASARMHGVPWPMEQVLAAVLDARDRLSPQQLLAIGCGLGARNPGEGLRGFLKAEAGRAQADAALPTPGMSATQAWQLLLRGVELSADPLEPVAAYAEGSKDAADLLDIAYAVPRLVDAERHRQLVDALSQAGVTPAQCQSLLARLAQTRLPA